MTASIYQEKLSTRPLKNLLLDTYSKYFNSNNDDRFHFHSKKLLGRCCKLVESSVGKLLPTKSGHTHLGQTIILEMYLPPKNRDINIRHGKRERRKKSSGEEKEHIRLSLQVAVWQKRARLR